LDHRFTFCQCHCFYKNLQLLVQKVGHFPTVRCRHLQIVHQLVRVGNKVGLYLRKKISDEKTTELLREQKKVQRSTDAHGEKKVSKQDP